jgi:hypothetical protein
MYILIEVYGGLIDSCEVFDDPKKAKAVARKLWAKADPEADDIKIFDTDICLFIWLPKK